MAGHTPGPWEAKQWGRGGIDIVGPRGEDLGYVNCGDGADDPVAYPHEANARLIAAAPELLEALKEVLGHVEDENIRRVPENQCTLCFTYRSMARAAIQKAEGGQ